MGPYALTLILLLVSYVCDAATLRRRVPADLPTGLIAHWRLEEGTGVAFDSWGTNHLTRQSSSITNAAGKMLLCNGFGTGSADYFTTLSTNLQKLPNTNFAVSVWFNFQSNLLSGNSRFTVSERNASATEFAMDMLSNSINQVRWYCNTGSFGILTFTNIILPSNTWNFAVGWRSGTYWALRVYSPGVNAVTTNLTIGVAGNVQCCAPFLIGNGGGTAPGDQWRGLIDSVSVWNRSLTTNEMDFLWNLGHGELDYFTQ